MDSGTLAEAAARFPPDVWERGARWALIERTTGLVEWGLDLALLAGLALSGPGRRLHERCLTFGRRLETPASSSVLGEGWAGSACFLLAMVLLRGLVALPFLWGRDFFAARAFGLSHQGAVGFALDLGRSTLGAGIAFGAMGAVLPWLRRRWPRTWWLRLGAMCAALVWLDAAADPARMRLDHPMRPLEEGPLRARILSLAAREGVPVGDVMVLEVSRETTAVNAFSTGAGPTTALVLTDTLLAMGDEAAAGAAAHEIGHRRPERLPARLAGAMLGIVALLGLVEAAIGRASRLGAGTAAQAMPLVVVAWSLGAFAFEPVRAGFARGEEAEADRVELAARADLEAYVAEQVRLARANAWEPHVSPPWSWVATHPSPVERVARALEAARQRADAVLQTPP